MFLISGTQRRCFFINENMFGNYMRVGYMVFVKVVGYQCVIYFNNTLLIIALILVRYAKSQSISKFTSCLLKAGI